jgi:hypothetical protein
MHGGRRLVEVAEVLRRFVCWALLAVGFAFAQESPDRLSKSQRADTCAGAGDRAVEIKSAEVIKLVRKRTAVPVPDRLHDSNLHGEIDASLHEARLAPGKGRGYS